MLCVLFFCVNLWEKNAWDSQWGVLSLTERTEFTEVFGTHFEPTEGLRHTEVTEAFQLTLAVTLCDISWLNVSVKPCVFCSSVSFCERKIVGYSQWEVLSLTERTEFTEPFGAHFELTEGLRHTENTERFCWRLGENWERGEFIE